MCTPFGQRTSCLHFNWFFPLRVISVIEDELLVIYVTKDTLLVISVTEDTLLVISLTEATLLKKDS